MKAWLVKPLATVQPLPSMEVKVRKLFHPSSCFIFLCGSDWIISFDLSLGVLTLSSIISILLLDPFIVFLNFHCCFSLVNF